ncbi:MAG: HPr family phosphocarrier protein [Fusicatenibacter sp.]|nr:HPr family phosphocarrier protein [Lachnospiraceae bacterium]MDY2938578.1 HPr family phosphocarrier protein [Fusicatenibacter sp.]
MISKKVKIINPSGLHLKNAVVLSNSVSRYKSVVQFAYENNGVHGTANLKSILSIVAAGIAQGEEIEICCSGEDEEEALASVVEAVESGLGEPVEKR